MKTTIMKISFIFLFLSLLGAGCEKEEEEGLLLEISPDSETSEILKEVEGIEFKFCLLNEKGESATVFNEGENFSFLFLIKNKTAEALSFYDYGFYTTDEFLSVRSGAKNYGQPMKFLSLSINTTKELRWIISEGVAGFSVLWHEERSEIRMMHGYFEGLKQPYLAKGKYYTKFTYNFTFGYPNKIPETETGKLTFKINFEIK